MNKRLLSASLIGLAAMTAQASAVVPGVELASSKFSIGLAGYVPVICRAKVDASYIRPDASVAQLGLLNEFCNSPTGYRVMADHSASLTNASLFVDGIEVPLGREGSTVISTSDRAAIASHDLALTTPEGVVNGSISFRIEPL